MSQPAIRRYFEFGHLPYGSLRRTSQLFASLADELIERLPPGPEATVALRKLLESKDAAVRASLDIDEEI